MPDTQADEGAVPSVSTTRKLRVQASNFLGAIKDKQNVDAELRREELALRREELTLQRQQMAQQAEERKLLLELVAKALNK